MNPGEPDFRALFESAPGACLVVEPAAPYAIVAASDAYLQALGTQRDAILGRALLPLLPAELRAPLTESLQRAASRRAPDVVTAQRVDLRRPARPDGARFWRAIHSPVLRPDGTLRYIIHCLEDATEHDQRLVRLQDLFDQASDSIFIADLDGRFTDVNATACKMLGYTRDELLRMGIVDILSPDEVGRLAAAREYLMTPGTVQVSEWSLRKKDGAYIPVEVSAKILEDGRWMGFARDISERKRVERELRESQERFRLAFDDAPIGMALLALDGRFTRVNRAMCEIVGYEAEELTRLHFQEITHPDDLPGCLELVSQLARGDISRYQMCKRYLHKDGSPVDVALTGSVLRDNDGAAVCYMAQVEDITVRKRAEEALRLSEAKSSGIISVSADAIISIDEKRRITLFNQGAERIFGYRQDDVVGAPFEMLIPERLRAAHGAHVDKFAAGVATARRMGERDPVISGLRKNGEEFPADAAISKLEVGGRTILTIALRDITERVRQHAEQQFLAAAGAVLASSLDYQETLAGIAQLVVANVAELCIVDLVGDKGQIERRMVVHADAAKASACEGLAQIPVNPRRRLLSSHVFETKRATLSGDVSAELVDISGPDDEQLRLLRALELRSMMAVPLVAASGLVGALVFGSSRPDEFDAQDLALAEELGRRAALAIEAASLYQIALRATHVRDDVLAIVAHDLRNPLSAIGLAAQVLQHQLAEEGSGRGTKSVETILRSLARANRLIQDLLDVTRLEGGGMSLELGSLAVTQLVFDAVEAEQLIASSSSLELRIDVDADLPDVWADRDRMHQVLENLIGNAIKFTSAGGSITVGAKARIGEVLFWVADTGVGISADSLHDVFDRFWQASRARRSGAGLGLPICKGIIEAQGGRIWAESEERRGTTFYFTVPTAPVAGTHATPPPPPMHQ